MQKIDIRHFLFAQLRRQSAPILCVRSGEPPRCLSTSQAAFVRLLSRSINHSFMRSSLRVLLLPALCYSALFAHAEDSSPTRLKYGAWGFDLAGMDTATKPGDDFFRYANGTWLDKTQIPSDSEHSERWASASVSFTPRNIFQQRQNRRSRTSSPI